MSCESISFYKWRSKWMYAIFQSKQTLENLKQKKNPEIRARRQETQLLIRCQNSNKFQRRNRNKVTIVRAKVKDGKWIADKQNKLKWHTLEKFTFSPTNAKSTRLSAAELSMCHSMASVRLKIEQKHNCKCVGMEYGKDNVVFHVNNCLSFFFLLFLLFIDGFCTILFVAHRQ